jgi:hypothetical protein
VLLYQFRELGSIVGIGEDLRRYDVKIGSFTCKLIDKAVSFNIVNTNASIVKEMLVLALLVLGVHMPWYPYNLREIARHDF